jgi:hypothetical protein
MVKVVTLYKDVKNYESFEKTFREKILPFGLQTPGMIKIQITSLFQMSLDVSQKAGGFQFIVEAHLESLDVLQFLITSPEGIKTQEMMVDLLGGEMSIFIGKEKNYFPIVDQT